MRIRTIHRLARLEVEARPYIQRVQAQKASDERQLGHAVEHAAVLAFILRYGKPRIEEPLWRACQRCEQSDAWKECCERFPTALGEIGYEFRPYEQNNFHQMGRPLRHAIHWFFAGTNEKDKLNRVFKSGPPWFVWFTFADHTARVLKLAVPNLSSITRFERSHKDLEPGDWYGVPEGKFERRRWDNSIVKAEPVYANVVKPEAEEDQSTSRERQRALRYNATHPHRQQEIWPRLSPLEIIELSLEEHLEIVHASSKRDALLAVLKRKYPERRLRELVSG